MTSEIKIPFIRLAMVGDERGIHEAHMRSIREVCSEMHSAEEIIGWGNRPLTDRWNKIISEGYVWVVEFKKEVEGVAYIKMLSSSPIISAHIYSLYLTPKIIGQGYGVELMQLMLGTAKRAGAKVVTLDSTLNAHDFYKRFGFKDTGPLKWREIGGSLVRGYPMMLNIGE